MHRVAQIYFEAVSEGMRRWLARNLINPAAATTWNQTHPRHF